MSKPDNTPENAASEELEYEWMIKPCAIYKDEFKDCSSIRARFHQYFIFGEILDCKQWKKDYINCCQWEKNKNKEAYNELIANERERRFKRLKGHYGNNVWEKRDKPPENWNAPLPTWLEERNKNSYLKYVNDHEKQRKEIGKYSCIIM
ncbi:PREDICTED: UPF0545 protein C22orf39 homolog [Eufriesea mexicana]|uniref:UPF0545 protein C22orf39 homolog n=1 Tax=Eufriesea mexicana TaxID=516756 RepID=UPI00083C6AB6|nr:PREDICTED: UPF0545 protein C22orf39 homolog [Eufriesea mexicana]